LIVSSQVSDIEFDPHFYLADVGIEQNYVQAVETQCVSCVVSTAFFFDNNKFINYVCLYIYFDVCGIWRKLA